MMTISELPFWVLGLFCCWILVLIWGFLTDIMLILRYKNRRKAYHITVLSICCTAVYLVFQFLTLLIGGSVKPYHQQLVNSFGDVYAILLFAACILCSAEVAIYTIKIYIKYLTRITGSSIKEAVETLPDGICVYEKTGRIILKNKTMERLYGHLTKEPLLNGIELEKSVFAPGGNDIILMPDNTTWHFAFRNFNYEGRTLSEIKANNITEEYRMTKVLEEKRSAVQALNERLVTYNHEVVALITSKEILNAKIKIHDELGAGLLSMKHYILKSEGGDDEAEKDAIIEGLNRNLSYLLQESDTVPDDEYELMLDTSAALGVKIETDGTLPSAEPYKHIVATAMHECFTNTLRHAKGDRLYIAIYETADVLEVTLTNNGNPPQGTVSEKGGLLSLRKLTEQSGGIMEIKSAPSFELKLTFNKTEIIL